MSRASTTRRASGTTPAWSRRTSTRAQPTPFSPSGLGVKKVYILNDKEAYGLGVASNFRHAAQRLRITIAGFEALDPKASSYEALASKIKDSGVNCGLRRLARLRERRQADQGPADHAGPNVKLILPDGFTPISSVVEGAGAAAESAYVSVAGLPNSKLTGQGRAFLVAFTKANHKPPNPYSVYAAQATVAMLSAIARSNGTRADVTRKIFTTNLRGSITGNLRFNLQGDVTGGPVAIYRIKGGKSTDYTVIYPPEALVKAA